ncbi:translocation/assembly module TamB domain-containing protein [Sulfobacillus acidophilus]|uniref:Translocation/assembly module TamB domain-containing protein n=1 Tax=Sulfobacillus acidophilus TaxID=53633 RepID=A0ABS3AW98_9FIRM|nr:translocation/assembly module TamB domain-containing protein [Sulfobacillus acidophilus]
MKLGRILLIGCLGSFLLAVGVGLLMKGPILHKILEENAHTIGEKYGLKIDFAKVESSVGFDSITISLVELTDNKGQFHVSAKSIKAKISLISLLLSSFPLTSIEVIEPEFYLEAKNNEPLNIKESISQFAHFIDKYFLLNSLFIKDGLIQLQTPLKEHILLKEVNAHLKKGNEHLDVFIKTELNVANTFLVSDLQFDGQLTKGANSNFDLFGVLETKNLQVDNLVVNDFVADIRLNKNLLKSNFAFAKLAGAALDLNFELELNDNLTFAFDVYHSQISLNKLLNGLGKRNSNIDLSVEASMWGEGQIFPGFKVEGEAKGVASNLFITKGPFDKSLKNPIILQNANEIKFSSNLTIDRTLIKFTHASLYDGVTKALFDGKLFFNKKKDIFIKGAFEKLNLSSIRNKIAKLEYYGNGQGQFRIFGPFNDLSIRSDLSITEFGLNDFSFGDAKATLEFNKAKLFFRSIKGVKNKTFYKAFAKIKFDEQIDEMKLHVDITEGMLNDLKLILPKKDRCEHKYCSLKKIDIDGYMKASGDFFALFIKGDKNKYNVKAKVTMFDEGGEFKFELFEDNTKISIANLNLSKIKKIAEKNIFMNGNLNFTASFFEKSNSLSGKAKLLGEKIFYDNWDLGSAKLDFVLKDNDFKLFGKLHEKDVEVDFKGSWQDSFFFDGKIKSIENDFLKLNGFISAEDLNIKASAKLDLKNFLNSFDNINFVQGTIFADASLGGSIKKPKLLGKVALDNGTLAFNALASDIKNISFLALLNGQLLEVSRLKGKIDGGVIDGSGKIFLSTFVPKEYDLTAKFFNLPLNIHSWLSSTINGQLQLTGQPGNLLLAGDIKVLEGRIIKEGNWDKIFSQMSPSIQFVQEKKSIKENLRLNIGLSFDKGIFIQNSNINSQLLGNIHLLGTRNHPRLKGSITALFGEVYFRNNHYQILKARADFDEYDNLLPKIDIEAQTRINEYDISAHIEGKITKPSISLVASPPLSEIDALSLMTLGCMSTDLTGITSVAKTAGLEMIASYSGIGQKLLQLVPNNFKHSSLVSLDELRFFSAFSHTEGLSLPAIGLGADVFNGLRLRLQSTLMGNEKGSFEQKLELEQRLNKKVHWRLTWESEGESNFGDAGADLWYRWDF